ncbi:MAG: undecaprenyldiphospho-muramoylpentapeptide beta-N-acetylglucosaminyltransferase [Candidatus Omnitrophota bacterium]
MKILVVAGGTGGHMFPALAVADKIKEINPSADIVFCIDKRIKEKASSILKYKYLLLEAPKMPYGITLRWFPFFAKLLSAYIKAGGILKEVNPDIVVGFGAYICGPALTYAKRIGKKVIIHEQNVTMGRANRFLSGMSDKIAISFDGPQYKKDKRFIITGNPIRGQLLKDLLALDKRGSRELLELGANRKTILVVGGSLGSHVINTTFLQMLNRLPDNILNDLQIIHLTGEAEFANVQSAYKDIKVKYKAYPFFERMGLLYKAADFAVCRAGASTVAELLHFALPAILIPYTGAGAHQVQNARFLEENSAGLVIEEKRLTPDTLKSSVLALLNDNERLSSLSRNAHSLANKDAAKNLAEIILAAGSPKPKAQSPQPKAQGT